MCQFVSFTPLGLFVYILQIIICVSVFIIAILYIRKIKSLFIKIFLVIMVIMTILFFRALIMDLIGFWLNPKFMNYKCDESLLPEFPVLGY